MNCSEVRELLLEADLDTLEGSPLETHLEGCGECAALLDRLLEGESLLGEELARAATRVAPEIDPAKVRIEAVRARRIPWRRAWVPVLAAAAVAGVTFFGPWARPTPRAVMAPEWTMSAAEGGSIRPMIESRSHDQMAVLRTNNPDITVVWLMDSRGG